MTTCLATINRLKVANGLALADIITALSEHLATMEIRSEAMITWLDGLAEIEYRIASGGSESIQTGAVVGVVREGCELAA